MLVEIIDNSSVLEIAIGSEPSSIVEINNQTIEVIEFSSVPSASAIRTLELGSATFNTVQEIINTIGAGLLDGCEITDNLDGTVAIAAGSGLIRSVDVEVGFLFAFDIAALPSLALTDQEINYVYVEYNAGTPQFTVTTAKLTDHHTNVFIGNVYRDGTTLHINTYRSWKIINNAPHTIERMLALQPMEHESGALISETGVRNIVVSSGYFWEGLNRLTFPAFDSSGADTFRYFYRDGLGGWTEVPAQSQINNLYYDDGSGVLAALGVAKYGVHWVYAGTDGDVYVVYGRGNYNLAQAEDEAPDGYPPHIESHGRLIGRIIILQGAGVFQSIDSVFTQTFPTIGGGGVTDHTLLTNIGVNSHVQIDTHIANQDAGLFDSNSTGVGETLFTFDSIGALGLNGNLYKFQNNGADKLTASVRANGLPYVFYHDTLAVQNDFYLGYHVTDQNYSGMFNNFGDFFLGVNGDAFTYVNYYAGAGMNIGSPSNLQTITEYIGGSGHAFTWSGSSMTLKPNATDLEMFFGVGGRGMVLPDSTYLKFGTDKDAAIYYDATNLIINPKLVGAGILDVKGSARIGGDLLGSDFALQMGLAGDSALGYDGADTILKNLVGSGSFKVQMPLAVTGAVTGTSFNGVALTTGGSASQFLGGDGTYQTLIELDISDLQTYLLNIVEDTTPQLGGSLSCLNNNLTGIKTATFNSEIANVGNAQTIDWTAGQKQKSTITATTTSLSFTAPVGICNLTLKLVNGGLAAFTWPVPVIWPNGGAEPTWSVSGTDIISFYHDGANYYASAWLA